MKEYLKNVNDVLQEVNSSDNGISSKEADERLEKNGKNKLKEPKKDGILKKFLKSLLDPMIIMLLAAAAISAVTAVIQGENFTDVFIILFVVIVNTILGMVQESKAEHAIDSLMEMTKATSKTIRDGNIKSIKSEDLVVGDVIILEAGDSIPADCRILESYSMKVEEAAITGESVPVNKIMDILYLEENALDISLGDRTNMLYSGSTVVYGRGKAVVVATGMDTQMGKIADALQNSEDEQTPLQKKMAELSKILTWIVIGISVFVFLFGIIKSGDFSGGHILDAFLVAVALAVAAIPEGLPAVVTIILSIGVTSMAKRQALIRKLSAVETLGCTQIICTDKTGTLTQNKMTVTKTETTDEKLLAEAMALCSDADIKEGEKESIGEPTEAALVNFAYKIGLPKYELVKKSPRIGEAPFDSNRKMMSTVHKSDNGKIIQYTKGACEILLDRCSGYLQDGKIVDMTDEIKNKIKNKNKEYADQALRVLGAAYKEYDKEPNDFSADKIENNLIFIGFVGMIDPCRPEVYEAIKECRNAGIRPVMITGDHVDTAAAIGKDLNIIESSDQAITGSKIDAMSDEELINTVKTCSVFARVQPEHKTRIVKAFKSQGYVVAMTGDGVNDAPSIKTANIGACMGITGTDVTKEVSDIIISDDNYSTVVLAIKEGRTIYQNIQKTILFLLSTNIVEVLGIFVTSLMLPDAVFLLPTQILFINLVTDSLPAFALGIEPSEKGIMDKPPRDPNKSLLSGKLGTSILYQGFIQSLIVLIMFVCAKCYFGNEVASTMSFLTICLMQIIHAINCKTEKSIFKSNIFKNKFFNFSFLILLAMILCVEFIPFFAGLFNLCPLNGMQWLIVSATSLSIIPLVEIGKLVIYKKEKVA